MAGGAGPKAKKNTLKKGVKKQFANGKFSILLWHIINCNSNALICYEGEGILGQGTAQCW